MKELFQITVLCLTGLNAVTAWSAGGFDRYQIILERKPFGEPPPILDVPPPPEQPVEDPPWARTYRLCSVYESNSKRVQVALLDMKTNKPVMLTLGEPPVEGIELISADILDEEAILLKNGQRVTMKLEASKAPKPRVASKSKKTRKVSTRNSSRSTAMRSNSRARPIRPAKSRTSRRKARSVQK